MRPRSLAWLVLSAAFSAAQEPPPPAPVFPAAVEQVVVDAVVLDGQGAAVAGLSRDDFLVTATIATEYRVEPVPP